MNDCRDPDVEVDVDAEAEAADNVSFHGNDNDETISSPLGVQFSLRALALGLALGILVNLSNTYYGLQAGISNQMPMITGLLGYLIIKSLKKFSIAPLSVGENVLIISAATATGCMPVTAGFTGVIPALEFVLEPEDGGRINFSIGQLFLWSLGLAFFGINFAAWLRKRFVDKGGSPWPGPKAAARILSALHSDVKDTRREPPERLEGGHGVGVGVFYSRIPNGGTSGPSNFGTIFRYGTGSLGVTILTLFLPILRQLPIFGIPAAEDWLWSFNLSPGFIGQGIITGLAIPCHMLAGAVVGWAILSPLAMYNGWAHGPVGDWETGSRSWIIWVSLSCLMADAGVFLIWFIIEPTKKYLDQQKPRFWPTFQVPSTRRDDTISNIDDENTFASWNRILASTSVVMCLTMVISICICIVSVNLVFGLVIPWYFILLAILLALPMAVVGIRALAECDFNPESGLLSQLVFAAILRRNNGHALLTNLVSAGIASACASQAGDIAYDFKIGGLVGANPSAQIYGHIAGSVFGSFVAAATYRLYTSHGSVPGPVFQIPAAYLSTNTSKLLLGKGLPDGVRPFVAAFGAWFGVVAVAKLWWPGKRWHMWVPSGTAFAIGMLNTPSFSLPRVVGGLVRWLYAKSLGGSRDEVIGIGTGLILGETIGSVITLALSAFMGL